MQCLEAAHTYKNESDLRIIWVHDYKLWPHLTHLQHVVVWQTVVLSPLSQVALQQAHHLAFLPYVP